jgi:hypothetical protein
MKMRLRAAAVGSAVDAKTRIRQFTALLALSLLGGCAHHYTPDASRPFEPITEFSSASTVSLQNGQPSTEEVLFFDPALSAHSYYANLNKWTDVAIEIAAGEMKKRGMKIENSAQKTITMSVQAPHTERGFTEIKTQIPMEVKTSDGYSATYIGKNNSVMAAIIYRQVDGALMRVVHEMMLDPRIVSFLTK